MAEEPEDDDDAQAEKNQALRARARGTENAAQQRQDRQGYQSMLARTPAAKKRRELMKKLYDGPPNNPDDE